MKLRHKRIDPNLKKIEYTTEGPIPLYISIDKWQDGGGAKVYSPIRNVICNQYKNRKFKKCLDWCSGTGVIAFDLYSYQVAENISLLDSNVDTLVTAKQIAIYNKIADKLKVHALNTVSLLPKSEMFDLVVGAPPLFDNLMVNDLVKNKKFINNNRQRLGEDKDWKTHIDFFSHIKNHLSPDGIIFLLQTKRAVSEDFFKPTIEANELKITNVHLDFEIPDIYILEITHNE